VNVKSDQYGAVGDGATDDTAAIQAAENAASAFSGGAGTDQPGAIVYFPPGTYMASGIIKQSNAHRLRSGFGTTYIKLKNSAPTTTPLVIGANFATLTATKPRAALGGISGCTLGNISFDGNKSTNASHSVPLIQIYGFGYIMDSVSIVFAKSAGLYSEWTNAVSPIVLPFGFECRL